MSFSYLYTTPTPLEQAYAQYVLQHCFSSPFFPMSGREAVVFLTTSNLPRLLLRELWNVVDPQHDGKLHYQNQWWTLLKLVALAQQQDANVNNVHVLLQDLYTVTSLPVFANVVIPSNQVLLQQYTSHTSLSLVLDELGPSHDAPLPSLLAGVHGGGNGENVQRQDDNDEFGNFEASPETREEQVCSVFEAPVDFNLPRELHTLSSALDELGGVQDAPLPSWNVRHDVDQQQEQDDNDDEFGDFEAPPLQEELLSTMDTFGNKQSMEQQQQQQEGTPHAFVGFDAPKQVTSLAVALEELGGVLDDAPLPSWNATAVEQQEEDDFGDFEAPAA